eukprot:41388_1
MLLFVFSSIFVCYCMEMMNAESCVSGGCQVGYHCLEGSCVMPRGVIRANSVKIDNDVNPEDHPPIDKLNMIQLQQTTVYVIAGVIALSFLLCLCYSNYTNKAKALSPHEISRLQKKNIYV